MTDANEDRKRRPQVSTLLDAFEQLCESLEESYPAIERARRDASEQIQKLTRLAGNGTPPPAAFRVASPDTSIVVFGSLARREWTTGSDVDWTLLVDSPADPHHRSAAQEFGRRLDAAEYRPPGPAAVFGSLSFSHDLIHRIGGEHDTNTNMTQRLLLLLESTPLGNGDAHERVVRGIMRRYLESERSFLAESGRRYKVPRFLLNDIVRYWRTVAVDYVSKQWERGDEGWALRNVKLRYSRKLMFASGLLLCFSCYLDEPADVEHLLFKDEHEAAQKVQAHLARKLGVPPLDILCAALQRPLKKETATRILSAYDLFLQTLNDSDKRAQLKKLSPEASYADPVFKQLRDRSHEFDEGLTALFYEGNDALRKLILKYGVF